MLIQKKKIRKELEKIFSITQLFNYLLALEECIKVRGSEILDSCTLNKLIELVNKITQEEQFEDKIKIILCRSMIMDLKIAYQLASGGDVIYGVYDRS